MNAFCDFEHTFHANFYQGFCFIISPVEDIQANFVALVNQVPLPFFFPLGFLVALSEQGGKKRRGKTDQSADHGRDEDIKFRWHNTPRFVFWGAKRMDDNCKSGPSTREKNQINCLLASGMAAIYFFPFHFCFPLRYIGFMTVGIKVSEKK